MRGKKAKEIKDKMHKQQDKGNKNENYQRQCQELQETLKKLC